MIHPRAAVFQGPGSPFLLQDLPPFDLPGPGECLVQITLATLCGSDLHTHTGRRHGPTPCILGHEAVGRVLAVGEGRDPALVGSRVTWTLADSCGKCAPCSRWNLPQKCDHLFKYGHAPLTDGSGLNGCYSTHILLRAGTTVVPLPDSITDSMAAPANCALATMIAVLRDLPSPQDTVVIQGAGLLGLYGTALLHTAGWRRVIVVDRNPERLRLVPAMGGIPALDTARDLVSTHTADVVIEVAGSPDLIPEGIQLLRPGGHYAWVGMVHPGSQLQLTGEAVIRGCLHIHGTHNYTPADLVDAVHFLQRHATRFPWESLVSEPLPIAQLDQAFALAATGQWPRVAIFPDPTQCVQHAPVARSGLI